MGSRLVLFGYGNPSRGDDALGPLLLERAETWLGEQSGLDVTTVGDFQLQIEHVLDLQGRDLALFLDADVACPAPYALRRVMPSRDSSYTTHELSPQALLQVYRQATAKEPPPAFVLSVRGDQFELGAPLSPAAEGHLAAAWTFLKQLLAAERPGLFAERAG